MLKTITTLIVAMLFSSSVLSAEQVITTQPSSQSATPSQSVAIEVTYSTANPASETLTGLGLQLHWDSSALTFRPVSNVFPTSLFARGNPEPDSLDLDGDPKTDMLINISWADFGGNWSGAGSTPVILYTANFTANASFSESTSVNFSASSTAAGYTLDATSATIDPQQALIPVPDVTGQTQENAEATITAAGLSVGNISTQASDTVPSGSVISQAPTAGNNVAAGSSVDLVVSSGEGLATVPDVTGETQENAEAAITAAGLTVGTISTQSSNTVPNGSVISQSPTAGNDVAAGSSVDLVISSGGEEFVTVPDVTGQTAEDALTTLTAAGLTVGSTTTQPSNTVAAGSIISQTPTAGSNVSPGTAIDGIISSGPAVVIPPPVEGAAKPIPTLSFWGLLALSGLLSIFGVNSKKRKQS